MEPTTASPVSISLSELNIGPDWASQLGDQPAGQVVWGEVTTEGGRRGPRRGGFREGERDRGPRGDGRGSGGGRGFGGGGDFRGPRPPGGPGGGPRGADRARGFDRGKGGRPGGGGDRPEGRRDGPPRGGRDFRGGGGFRRDEDRRPPVAPLTPGWRAVVVPEPSGVENLTVQIKATGRAYPVFDLARLFLSSNDRLRIRFEPEPGRRTPPLVLCAVDGSLWLTHDEAKQHFIRSGLLGNFFNEEKVTVDPPKGVFTAIAVCGFSGAVLGPPNFHDYQRAIIRLHQERFKNMPLDRYKSRVRIERDEELVKKWVESQSTQSRYTLLDGGENPPVFQSTEDAARYLLEHREAELFADAPSVTVPGTLDYGLLSPGLATHFRATLDQQRRFPLELVQELCRQFEGQGLRFFKENKRETYVSRSRPRPLDPGLAVSERVKAIVAHVRAHTGCTYNDVLVALAPKMADTPAETPVESSTETPAEAPAPVETPEAEEPSEADREGIAILQDLRWLIREGYVTEFANGELRVVERQEKPIIIQPPKRLRLYGRAFSLWTRPYLPPRFQPGVRLPGRGFTLWTKAHVLPPAKPVRPPKPGKSPRPEPAAATEPPPEPVASSAEPAPLETPAPAPVETAPPAAEVSTPVETPAAE